MAHTTRFGRPILVTALLSLLVGTTAQAQLRVVTWNVSNYNGGRVTDIQTAVYSEYLARSMSPDVILCQEFLSSSAMTTFKNALNSAAGSPGDWLGVFVNGPDTNNAFFYRTDKVQYLGYQIVSYGGSAPNPPRHCVRFAVRLQGYSYPGAVLCCYSSHMKAGTGSDDRARRLLECQRIRDNAQVLNSDWHFLLGGDFNIQSSGESAYQELVGNQANNDGRFFDPINTPGSWNNSSYYRFVHTQDPSGSGGMDDRYDQILISDNLIDDDGFEYIGNYGIAYSTSTWNDPNHSYRCWGNDGSSFNQTLRTTGNTMVGPTIAQALKNVATAAGGHLPVYLDFRVPAEIGSDEVIDFGQVEQDATAEAVLEVWNAGDVALWTAYGIADLEYTLAASAGFGAPGGTFVNSAGDFADQHTITMDTSTVGPVSGTLTIESNAPDEPSREVTLVGEVIEPSTNPGDMDCNSQVDFDDIDGFVLALGGEAGYYAVYPDCEWMNADCDEDGDVDFDDIDAFVALLGG